MAVKKEKTSEKVKDLEKSNKSIFDSLIKKASKPVKSEKKTKG